MSEKTYTFPTSEAAWAFMREQDDAGNMAGYPSLKAPYTVRVIESPVRSITFQGREYRYTGKVGTNRASGKMKAEYACKEPGIEHRAWANYDGTEIEAD